MKDEPELRTLCKYCKSVYEQAGFTLTSTGWQEYKTPCDLCGRPGYEYIMKEPEKDVKQKTTLL